MEEINSLERAKSFATKRLQREWKTLEAMIGLYCGDQHQPAVPPRTKEGVRWRAGRSVRTAGLCPECGELLAYAALRLERCRFGTEKPTCAHCPVHCYQRARRDQIKTVMRYAGPRMLYRHPHLSLWHWLDGFRKAPAE
jgi:hypothetical protein